MKLCAVVNIFIIYTTVFIDAVLTEYCLKCTSKIDQSFKRILTRKRRLVVFPPSASILLTPSLSKGLIAIYPRAVVNSIEVDFYHPLPETLEGWRPKIFDKKMKMPDKAKTMMGRNDSMSAVRVQDAAEAWAPSGGWSKPLEFEKFWIPTEIPTVYKSHVIPDGPFTKYNFKEDQQQYPNWQPHRKSWALPHTESFRPKYIYNWSNYRAHRERRELYETMESAGSLLRLNMKSCILRAICEAKHYLLPPGVSLVQDIIRTLFTNSPDGEYDDAYTNAGELNREDCSKMFENGCPFSIIEIVLHSDRFV